jgi:hypothetical protein
MAVRRGQTLRVRWTVERGGTEEEVWWHALVHDVHEDMLTLMYEAYGEFAAHLAYARLSGGGMVDLEHNAVLAWEVAEREASFGAAELDAMLTQECDDYPAEVCEQARRQWARLPEEQRTRLAQGLRHMPELLDKALE